MSEHGRARRRSPAWVPRVTACRSVPCWCWARVASCEGKRPYLNPARGVHDVGDAESAARHRGAAGCRAGRTIRVIPNQHHNRPRPIPFPSAAGACGLVPPAHADSGQSEGLGWARL